MKRIVSLLIGILMIVTLASCGGTTSDKPVETPKETPTAASTTEAKQTDVPTDTTPADTTTETPADTTTEPSADTTSESEIPTLTPDETEPPVTTPTPVDPLEKKRNNTTLLTEDDILIPYHVGVYEFVFEDGTKLGYNEDNEIVAYPADTVENCSFLVVFQNAGTDTTTVSQAIRNGVEGVRYILFAGESLENTVFGYSWSIEVDESNDNYMSSNWYILDEGDGKASLQNVSSDRYLCKNADGEVEMNSEDAREGASYKLTVNKLKEGTSCFNQYISEKGNIILRTADKLEKRAKLSKERLAKLANDMQTAYDTYVDLTSYRVWDSICIRIYRTEPYFGYIYPSWNTVSFNLDNAVDDMAKMPQRDKIGINDWSFCLMHEMGHMFDAYRGWKFHTEFATNFKVAYNLHVNMDVGASAATAEYGYRSCYDGDHIKEMWMKPHSKDWDRNAMSTFDLDRMLYVFVTYAEEIGWENVRSAYHEMQSWEVQETGDRVKQLNNFADTMAKYAPDNVHVKTFFKEGEWDLILKEIDGSTY